MFMVRYLSKEQSTKEPKTKRQPSKWDKIFANEATDKGLISKINSSCNSVKKKKNQKKRAEDLNTHFSKEDMSARVYVCVWVGVYLHLLSRVWLFTTPWTVAHQAPPSMGFSRQEYWSGVLFPPPGVSSQSRIRTWVSCIEGRFFILQAMRDASVTQSCPTLCDPVNHSTPGLPVHHQLPEFTQTHAHWVGDASQPSSTSVVSFSSCPQSFPASGSFPMSRLFASGGQSIGVCKYSNISPSSEHPGLISFRMDWLDLLAVQGTLKISRVFSNTTVQKHQFFSP